MVIYPNTIIHLVVLQVVQHFFNMESRSGKLPKSSPNMLQQGMLRSLMCLTIFRLPGPRGPAVSCWLPS
jgi:hypothetical protein